MQNCNDIAQQMVRMKRSLFVEVTVCEVTAEDVTLLPGTEKRVRLKISSQLLVSQRLRAIVFYKPYIGFACGVKHTLESKCHTAATLAVGKDVFGCSITIHDSHRATSAWNEPLSTVWQLTKNTGTLGRSYSQTAQGIVILFHCAENAVCHCLDTKELAIETYPLGTSQRRCLHVFGTLYDGNVQPFHTAIATAVFEWCQQQDIGCHVHNTFDVGIHAVAEVGDASIGQSLTDNGEVDVLLLADANNCIATTQLVYESTMYGSSNARTADRNLYS